MNKERAPKASKKRFSVTLVKRTVETLELEVWAFNAAEAEDQVVARNEEGEFNDSDWDVDIEPLNVADVFMQPGQ